MGEWYDYEVRFKGGNDLIPQMIQDGFLSETEDEARDSIRIHLQKIAEEIDKKRPDLSELSEKLTTYYQFPSITIGKLPEDTGLFYVNKWSPCDLIPYSISVLYPDKIIEFNEIAPYYDVSKKIDCKDAECVTASGIKVLATIYSLNRKQTKRYPNSNTAYVSLPIGPENDKWGTIKLPLECVPYDGCVLFTTDTVDVNFKSGTVTMPSEQVVDKYYEAKKAYREYAQKSMLLKDYPKNQRIEKENDYGNYFIIPITVPLSISEDGKISITASNYDCVNDNGATVDIHVGQRLKEKNVRLKKNSEYVTERFTAEKIRQLYEESKQLTMPNAQQSHQSITMRHAPYDLNEDGESIESSKQETEIEEIEME